MRTPTQGKGADAAQSVGKWAAARPANGKALGLTKFGKLSRADYKVELQPLELALNNLGRWLQRTGQLLAVLVEGRDTAGKGGVIAAITDTLRPCQCRVLALPKPDERERTQW